MIFRVVTIRVFALFLAFGLSSGCVGARQKGRVRTPIKGWERMEFPKLGISIDLPRIARKYSNPTHKTRYPYRQDAEKILIMLHPWNAGPARGLRYTFGFGVTRISYQSWKDDLIKYPTRFEQYPDDFSLADDVYFVRTQEGYLKHPNMTDSDRRNVYFFERGFRAMNGDVIDVGGSFDVIPGFSDQYFEPDRKMILRMIDSIKLLE